MSLFLGKIHYLLYNKIQLNEGLLEEILNLAEAKSIPVEEIKNRIYEKYGYPERGVLEDVISHDNIHGWLQSKIQSVENRTAAIVTELINNYHIEIGEIAEIYFQNGKNVMANIDKKDFSPKELFTLIYEYMLEGMPCDMINKVVCDSENEFSWETTRCIHKEHWDNVSGEVSNFYTLRNSWIKGFLAASGTNYSYIRTDDGYNSIR